MNENEAKTYIETISHLNACDKWNIGASIPISVVLAALARTKPGVIIIVDELDLETAIVYVKAFASGCQLYISEKMSPITAQKLTEILPIQCIACLPPTINVETAKGAARGLHPLRGINCLPNTPIEVIEAINKFKGYSDYSNNLDYLSADNNDNGTIQVGVTMLVNPGTALESYHQARMVQPGRTIRLPSNIPIPIAIAAAKGMQNNASLYLGNNAQEETLIAAAKSLNDAAILLIARKTPINTIMSVATALRKGCGLSLNIQQISIETYRSVVKKLDDDSFIVIDKATNRILVSKRDFLRLTECGSYDELKQQLTSQVKQLDDIKNSLSQNSFFTLSTKVHLNHNEYDEDRNNHFFSNDSSF